VFTGADDDTICSLFSITNPQEWTDLHYLLQCLHGKIISPCPSHSVITHMDTFQCDFYILGGHELIIYFPHYVPGNSSYNMD
jgi:hypothetical protein